MPSTNVFLELCIKLTLLRSIPKKKSSSMYCGLVPVMHRFDAYYSTSYSRTRHNSADSVPTSNLVCITEVAIRTTFCIAGIIYYTCNLVTDSQCTRYKTAFNKRF